MRLGAERPEIQEIRLFGSLARGQRNPFADADLLIVLDASDLPVRERIPHYKPTRIRCRWTSRSALGTSSRASSPPAIVS